MQAAISVDAERGGSEDLLVAGGAREHRGAALDVANVTMSFGAFKALDDVTARFDSGRVHAIVGQNGAGKTTFARVVCGLYEPTDGEVRIDGVRLPGNVKAAQRQGVDMVHQSFSLPPSFTVAEALYLFDPDRTTRPYRRSHLHRLCAAKLQEFGPEVDPGTRIRDLSVETRQGLEITRALAGNTRVLILDEPTAALPPQAVSELFKRVRRLAESGVTILVVLHKLAEVWAVADTVTVLRNGQVTVETTPIDQLTAEVVTEGIIGRDGGVAEHREVGRPESAEQRAGRETTRATDESVNPDEGARVTLENVTTRQTGQDASLNGVSLSVRSGEILGVAGVEGNGQQTLVQVIVGLQPVTEGRMVLDGKDVTRASVLARRAAGLRVIPFDRNTEGVSLSSPIWLNEQIGEILGSRSPWYSPRRVRERAQVAVEEWGVKFRNVMQPIGELSGGNVQRVILAREMSEGVNMIVAAQPTRGLDLEATAFVHATLRRFASEGRSVILVSSDLDELRANSDRLLVLRGGRIAAELAPTSDLSTIGAAMIGTSSNA
jgi:general nucleoside transport system ATP-binding protein